MANLITLARHRHTAAEGYKRKLAVVTTPAICSHRDCIRTIQSLLRH